MHKFLRIFPLVMLERLPCLDGKFTKLPLHVLFPAERNRMPPEQKKLCGKSPPRGNPGLKRTRTDAIWKKIEFKMKFK
jgi:hypothetical protein